MLLLGCTNHLKHLIRWAMPVIIMLNGEIRKLLDPFLFGHGSPFQSLRSAWNARPQLLHKGNLESASDQFA